MTISIEEMATFCKAKGFVYQDSEIYGSLSGFWDFGPLGVELKNNIKQHWWKTFVQNRQDVVGMDGSIITHRKIWEASGHADCFADLILTCAKCKNKLRADIHIEEVLNIPGDGLTAEQVNDIVEKNNLKCQKCNGAFLKVNDFNLMFETQVGPSKEKTNTTFLRPETAQLIFADFHLIKENARLKLPFGIAQIGKSFRNEISPRDFLFRTREFEQMEIEFFVHPDRINECPFFNEVKDMKINIITSAMQQKKQKHKEITVDKLTEFTSKWHAYWLSINYKWFLDLGIKPENIRIREHLEKELAHYAGACFDLEYNFPFGWKEIHGNADRTQFDIKQHVKASGKDINVYDEETKEKIIPYVASEPSQGVERAFLSFMFDAYNHDPENKERNWVVLKLHPKLTPIKVAVFPLVNKLNDKAKEIFNLLKTEFVCTYDRGGAIGRRYARADERGIPCCVTIDFDTIEKDNSVTIRDRDTTEQVRVKIPELKKFLREALEK